MQPVCHVGILSVALLLGLKYWNSDYVKPLQTPLAPASPHEDAMLHGSFSQLNTLTSRFAALEAVPVRWKGLFGPQGAD